MRTAKSAMDDISALLGSGVDVARDQWDDAALMEELSSFAEVDSMPAPVQQTPPSRIVTSTVPVSVKPKLVDSRAYVDAIAA
jgi:hypothetical protein